MVFRPGTVRGGEYRFAIGSAGSCTLVLQTVPPALLWFADGPSRVEVSGGTDNPSAPPADFIRRVLEPLLAKIGIHQQTTLLRHGFYPAGGGVVATESRPWHRLTPCNLASAGTLCRCVEKFDQLVCRAMLLSVKSLHWRGVFPCMNRIFITCRATRGRVIPSRWKSKVKISLNAFSSSVKARQCRGGSRAVSEEVKRYLASPAAVGKISPTNWYCRWRWRARENLRSPILHAIC
ncbi:RNA 3'-terminal phosphate cyclase [Escherichia coli]